MTLTVSYFRGLLEGETKRLLGLCERWDGVLESTAEINDEAQGSIRTTTGQARLLMNQRFAQFSGLVDNCEKRTGEKEITCEDLQGFWEMVYFQVEDVNKKFDSLAKLQESNWSVEQAKTPCRKPQRPKTKCVKRPHGDQPNKERLEAAKKRLAEAKARMAGSANVPRTRPPVDQENDETIILTPGKPTHVKLSAVKTPQGLKRTPRPLSKALKSTNVDL
ncbi:unnamed protein product [Ixodes hexagonus]